MEYSTDVRAGRYCVFDLCVHLVFVTRRRGGVFTAEMLAELEASFASVCRDFGAELAAFRGGDDYVHLLVRYPPKVAVSRLVNSLKGVSSRLLRKKYAHEEGLLWKDRLWSPSYLAVSASEADAADLIWRYLDELRRPRRRRFRSDGNHC